MGKKEIEKRKNLFCFKVVLDYFICEVYCGIDISNNGVRICYDRICKYFIKFMR